MSRAPFETLILSHDREGAVVKSSILSRDHEGAVRPSVFPHPLGVA